MPKRTHDGLKKRCDCGRRKWSKCSHPWHFSFHHAGREHRFSLDVVARQRGERNLPRTKSEADIWRDRLRSEIRSGAVPNVVPAAAAPTTRLTFADVVKAYRERYVNVPTRRPSAKAMFEIHLNMLLRAPLPAANGATVKLEDKPIADVTKADVEAIRAGRRAELARAAAARRAVPEEGIEPVRETKRQQVRRPGSKAGEVGINRLLARLRHVFSWAIAEGYVTETPFKRQGVTVIKLEHRAETVRQRRLQPGEETALLEHADKHLRALIVAALSTGCRLGELLSLQWSHVRRDDAGNPKMLALAAGQTKTNQARALPVGAKLRAILEMRQHDPAGELHKPTAFVFGNDVGEEVTSVRTAWEKACTAAQVTDLHFHDLRREFACRLLESSADLHDVRDFLGHANITTTSAYLASSPVRLARAMERLDALDAAAAPAAEEDPKDSHTVRTNEAEDNNGRAEGSAVTH